MDVQQQRRERKNNMKISEYNNRISQKFSKEDLTCIEYKSIKLPVKIRCNKCNNVYFFKKGESPLKKEKQTMCKKCTLTPQKVKTKNKVEYWYNTQGKKDFILLEINGYDYVKLQCRNCGEIRERGFHDILRGRGCSCLAKNTLISQEEFENEVRELFNGEYKVVGKYLGRHKKVLMKHSCGFIWGTTPSNLLAGKGCPKCAKKVSKGESEIARLLKENGVEFRTEEPITINGKNLWFDFYIPSLETYIEYNGIQHYKPVKFFGGEDQLRVQQYNDSLKRDFCEKEGKNLLVIRYDEDISLNVQRLLCSSK